MIVIKGEAHEEGGAWVPMPIGVGTQGDWIINHMIVASSGKRNFT